jgi:nitrous oxide reductase accessory protein NosL
MKNIKSFKNVLLVSLVTGLLAACGSDNDNDAATITTLAEDPTGEKSAVRVYHASPDAPKVNVWLDGAIALSGVDYQQSSGMLMVPAGVHTVQIDAILPNGDVLTVFPETELDLMVDTEYNVIALGKAAEIGDGTATEFAPKIVARDLLTPEGGRVQAIHAAPDAPMVDIFITAPNADLIGAMPFADDVEYLGATDAVEVPAGDYQIRITAFDDSTTVYYDSGTVTLPAGGDWVALATNNTGAGGSLVNLLVDTGTGPLVVPDVNSGSDIRVVHAISDAPGVDVWINDALSPVVNLEFKGVTGYLDVPAADYNFKVAVTGTETFVPNLEINEPLEATNTYTAIAIGNVFDSEELYVVADETRRVVTEAKLRAIHASPLATTLSDNVDIYVSADDTASVDDTIIPNVPYKGDTGLLALTPGEVYIIVTVAGDIDAIALESGMLDLAGSSITTFVVVDDGSAFDVISLDD